MQDGSKMGKTPSFADVLADIKRFLEQEKELFGETLLIEQPIIYEEPPMPSKKQVVADEPLLFELPKVAKPPITTEPWGKVTSLEEFNAQLHRSGSSLSTVASRFGWEKAVPTTMF